MRKALVSLGFVALLCSTAGAAPPTPLRLDLGGGDAGGYLRLVALFALISLAPVAAAVLTPFLRLLVVLFFLRAGLGNQQLLPNQVLIGLAALLTLLAMGKPLAEVNRVAVQPVLSGKVTPAQALAAAEPVARMHLQRFVRPEDLAALQRVGTPPRTGTPTPLATLAAAYVLGELRVAFVIGFVIFLPFLVIDLVVAGTLASLGLSNMPQAMLALPFKVLLFVMVDGWRLLAETLLAGLG